MAITWGSKVELERGSKSTVGFRLGYEAAQSGDTLTIKFYVNTKFSVYDTNNTFKVTIDGASFYDGKVTINTSSNSGGWSDTNTVLLKQWTTTDSGTVNFSASLTGVELDNDYDGSDLKCSVSGSATNWTPIKKGTTIIRDNFNNTFTITATKGRDGTNNTAGGPTNLKWGYTSTGMSTTYTNGQTITLKNSDNSKSTRTVYATSTTTAEHGDDMVATTSANVVQFWELVAPGKPVLYKTKTRLTTKEHWKYKWTGATTKNSTTSPIMGYRLFVYKNGSLIKGLKVNGDSTYLMKDDSSNPNTKDYAEMWIAGTEISFDPAELGFVPGDKVKFGLVAFTQWRYRGADKEPDRDNGVWKLTDRVISDESTVQNAGIMRVKAGSKWHEGQVWVKVSNKWVEADVVKIKTSAGWKESE